MPVPIAVNDANALAVLKTGEDLSAKGKHDEALRTFQAVYDYARDNLALLKCVKGAYDKALTGTGLDQNQKEDLYLKLQRIGGLTTRYSGLKGDSAYRIGVVHKAKGDSEQARKYLLDACQTAPFSLDPASTWKKSKDLLLSLANLEGEF